MTGIFAEHDYKTRLAVWLKYHYTLWSKSFTISLHLPGWLWQWADNYVNQWHERRARRG